MLPTFLIIGAMKCGTTSLYHYLAEHPEIGMSQVKETDYFVAERNLHRGRSWYESQFPTTAKACGEASPNYSKPWLFRGIPQRIQAELPEARLIYLVRDPIDRMISHYRHRFADGVENRPLCDALTADQRNPYLNGSRYFRNVKDFVDLYPLDRFLIVTSEELRDARQATLRRVFAFLDVDPEFAGPGVAMEWHRTETKYTRRTNPLSSFVRQTWRSLTFRGPQPIRPASPPDVALNDAAREWLINKLRPDIERLQKLAGRQFEAWKP